MLDPTAYRAEPVNPSRLPLTARQMQAYRVIADAWLSGQCASVGELATALDVRSKHSVRLFVEALTRKGWVERKHGSRTLRPRCA